MRKIVLNQPIGKKSEGKSEEGRNLGVVLCKARGTGTMKLILFSVTLLLPYRIHLIYDNV